MAAQSAPGLPAASGPADTETPNPWVGPALDPNLTFGTFALGADPASRLAHDVALSVTGATPSSDLVYLYGPPGGGKTHLLHAVGAQILAGGIPRIVGLISAADHSTRNGVDRLTAEDPDVLLVDDVELLSQPTLDALTFVVDRNDVLVVCTAACPPAHLTNAPARLRSRLSAGVVVEARYPDRPARLGILEALARRLNLDAPSEVIELLADLGPPDPRVLIGALRRLAVAAPSCGARLDAAFARSCVADLFGPVPPAALTAEAIVEATAAALGFTVEQLCGQARPKALCAARQTAMFLARRLTTASYPAIGRALGGKDHTTAMAAVDRVELHLRTGDSANRRRLEAVLQVLGDAVGDPSAVWAGARPALPAGSGTPSPVPALRAPTPPDGAPAAVVTAPATAPATAPVPVPAPGDSAVTPASSGRAAVPAAPATAPARATVAARAPARTSSAAVPPTDQASEPAASLYPSAVGSPPTSALPASSPRRITVAAPSRSTGRNPAVGGVGGDDAADAVVALVARGLTASGTRLDLLAGVTGIPTPCLQGAWARLQGSRSLRAVPSEPNKMAPTTGASEEGVGGVDAADAVVALVARGLTIGGTTLELLAIVSGVPIRSLEEARARLRGRCPLHAVPSDAVVVERVLQVAVSGVGRGGA